MFALLLVTSLHDPMLGAHGWKYVSHQGGLSGDRVKDGTFVGHIPSTIKAHEMCSPVDPFDTGGKTSSCVKSSDSPASEAGSMFASIMKRDHVH